MAEAKTNRYHVKIKAGFNAPSRNRAGVTILRGPGEVVDLTKEQVEALNEDQWFEVSEAGEGETAAPEDEGERGVHARPRTGATIEPVAGSGDEKANPSPDQTDEAAPAGETPADEAPANEPETVETLVRDNSRDELNTLAAEAGVEDAESLDNKEAVAQAIVDARG